MNAFIGLTIATWLIQIVFILSDIVVGTMEGTDTTFIDSKKKLLFILIPYS